MGEPSDLLYFDNNGTTFPTPGVISEMQAHQLQGNPSGTYPLAKIGCDVITNAKSQLYTVCNADPAKYEVVFTSGASESNNHMFYGILAGYNRWVTVNKIANPLKPLIMLSEIEHKTSINKAFELYNMGACAIDLITVEMDGTINPAKVKAALDARSSSGTYIVLMVSVMSANNETGVCNNVRDIATICANHQVCCMSDGGVNLIPQNYKVLFHTDATAMFGKYPTNMATCLGNAAKTPIYDAVSISFHKLHGPTQCGALILNRKFIKRSDTGDMGIYVMPLISGTQNNGMRGGTENISLLAGATRAMKETYANRAAKNEQLARFRALMVQKMREKQLHIVTATNSNVVAHWAQIDSELRGTSQTATLLNPGAINVVIINVVDVTKQMPHVISCVFIYFDTKTRKFVAIDKFAMRDALIARNAIVSTGSACSLNKDSYVLRCMRLPDLIKTNPLRISIGDHTTETKVCKFAEIVAEVSKKLAHGALKRP